MKEKVIEKLKLKEVGNCFYDEVYISEIYPDLRFTFGKLNENDEFLQINYEIRTFEKAYRKFGIITFMTVLDSDSSVMDSIVKEIKSDVTKNFLENEKIY